MKIKLIYAPNLYFLSYMEENEYLSKIDEDYKKIKEISVLDEKKFSIILNENIDDWQKLFQQIYKNGSFDFHDPDNYPYNRIISNGPYKIIEYNKNGSMVFELNENYYGKAPEIERLIIKFDSDKIHPTKIRSMGRCEALSHAVGHVFSEDKVSIHFCSFNARDHSQVEKGAKGLLPEGTAMTGIELCKLLGLNFEGLVEERKEHQEENMEFFINELKKIDEINKHLKSSNS